MSISNALNNAVSGLSAASRMAEVVASNTSNALTAGYARREATLTSLSNGGVSVTAISRQVSDSLVKESRLANAGAANATAIADFHTSIESLIGTDDATGSLSKTLSTFDSALIEATASPESTTALTNAVTAAKDVASKLNDISDGIQDARLEADSSIAAQVEKLNSSLSQIEDLNRAITRTIASGADANSLMDQRQTLIDEISSIVPVQTLDRAGNQVALYTANGLALLDATAATIGFEKVGTMTADMTLESGALSGLTVNGRAVSTLDSGALGGGSLSAAFSIRDELAPEAQANVDALARNLIERFEGTAVDPTLSAGDPGLFTDGGSALDTADEVGLAGRIKINAAVDPSTGGAVWRLRDGLAATAEGTVGNATLLSSLQDALSTGKVANSGDYGSTPRSASEFAASMLSIVSTANQTAQSKQTYAVARMETASQQLLAQGVDTDQEIQTLLQVETAYSANAKVISAIDEMMQTILEL
jgi:flagellar hook-associated protein 1 FlgK